MIFVEWRDLLVNPLPDDVRTYDWLLPGPYVYLAFPVLLVWAYRTRHIRSVPVNPSCDPTLFMASH